ncbi:MAG TPA: hypothetical protein VK524_15605, partial [Polyangiaceae bacterium]|nr:hypothetical protein [Polyangiaceae bacterium]
MSIRFRDEYEPVQRLQGQRWCVALVVLVSYALVASLARAEAPPEAAEGKAAPAATRAVDGMTTTHSHDPKVLGFTPLPGISPWPINPDDPLSSIPSAEELTKNALGFGYLLQDLSVEADKAIAAKNYARAEKFFLALAKAVPTRATAFAKLCAM